jgi:hypothetical protein
MTTASASGAPRITGIGSPRSERRSEVLEIPRTKRRRPTLNAFSAIEVLVPYTSLAATPHASEGRWRALINTSQLLTNGPSGDEEENRWARLTPRRRTKLAPRWLLPENGARRPLHPGPRLVRQTCLPVASATRFQRAASSEAHRQ